MRVDFYIASARASVNTPTFYKIRGIKIIKKGNQGEVLLFSVTFFGVVLYGIVKGFDRIVP